MTVDADPPSGAVDGELRVLLDVMADATGFDAPAGWDDEHDRWHLYQDALPEPRLHHHLRAALGHEPDSSVVTSVVLLAFDLDPTPERRDGWVASLSGEARDFVARRAHELVVLEAARGGGEMEDDDVTGWTHWLQRSAAEQATVRWVLEALAAEGQTRKIRNIATERLRIRRDSPRDSGEDSSVVARCTGELPLTTLARSTSSKPSMPGLRSSMRRSFESQLHERPDLHLDAGMCPTGSQVGQAAGLDISKVTV